MLKARGVNPSLAFVNHILAMIAPHYSINEPSIQAHTDTGDGDCIGYEYIAVSVDISGTDD